MKRSTIYVSVASVALLTVLIMFLLWKQYNDKSGELIDQSVQSPPITEEAVMTQPIPSDESIEHLDDVSITEPTPTPESFTELVDDLAEVSDEDVLHFQEEEWETMQGDAETVPPIFRIAP